MNGSLEKDAVDLSVSFSTAHRVRCLWQLKEYWNILFGAEVSLKLEKSTTTGTLYKVQAWNVSQFQKCPKPGINAWYLQCEYA